MRIICRGGGCCDHWKKELNFGSRTVFCREFNATVDPYNLQTPSNTEENCLGFTLVMINSVINIQLKQHRAAFSYLFMKLPRTTKKKKGTINFDLCHRLMVWGPTDLAWRGAGGMEDCTILFMKLKEGINLTGEETKRFVQRTRFNVSKYRL